MAKRQIGGCSYQNYNPELLERAYNAVQKGKSQRNASEELGVPRSITLYDYIKRAKGQVTVSGVRPRQTVSTDHAEEGILMKDTGEKKTQ